MEDDPSQRHHKLFIVGLVSLVMTLAFLGITLYMLPNLLFGLRYDTPEFFLFLNEWLQSQYGYTNTGASKIILLSLFIPTTFFMVVAYIFSNRIERQMINSDVSSVDNPVKFRKHGREGLYLALKILAIMIVVFIVASVLQWLIYYL